MDSLACFPEEVPRSANAAHPHFNALFSPEMAMYQGGLYEDIIHSNLLIHETLILEELFPPVLKPQLGDAPLVQTPTEKVRNTLPLGYVNTKMCDTNVEHPLRDDIYPYFGHTTDHLFIHKGPFDSDQVSYMFLHHNTYLDNLHAAQIPDPAPPEDSLPDKYASLVVPLTPHTFHNHHNQPAVLLSYYLQNDLVILQTDDVNHPLKVLVDNGASRCIMRAEYFNSLDVHDRPKLHKLPGNNTCRTGNGSVDILGLVFYAFVIQDIYFCLPFSVMDSTGPFHLLLGNNFLHYYSAFHDYYAKQIILHIPFKPMVPLHEITIQPHSSYDMTFEEFVPLSFPQPWTISGSMICWQVPMAVMHTYPRPFSVYLHNSCTQLRITNSYDCPLHLPLQRFMLFMDFRSQYKQQPDIHNTDISTYLSEVSDIKAPTPIFAGTAPPRIHEPCLQIKDTPFQDDLPSSADPFPWLEPEDIRRHQTDEEILKSRLEMHLWEIPEHLKQKFLAQILREKEAYSLRGEIGHCPFFEVHLQVKDDAYRKIQPYRKTDEEKKIIDKEIQRLEHLGIIRKGHTSFTSPCILIPRKNEKLLRVVTDFRQLNDALVKINHTFPLIQDCLMTLGATEADTLSLMDIRDAFHSLRLSPESQQLCGIQPYQGSITYMYTRLGMGLTVSPAVWQQFIDIVFSDLTSRANFKIMMDDILVFSKLMDHFNHLSDINQKLIQNGLKLSPHKCQYFRGELVYLGMVFFLSNGHACYKPMRSKCDAIRQLTSPSNPTQVRSFCGMVNFLSNFLPRLRELLAPLYVLTGQKFEINPRTGKKKRVKLPFIWTPECESNFQKIKDLLLTPPVLRMPTPDGLFRLESDTSIKAAGGCLYQHQSDGWCVIGYYSKRLPTVVASYSITELELFGLLINIHGFKQLLRDRHFEVLVDHHALTYIIKSKDEPVTLRLKKFLYHLRVYSFDLKYRKGKELFVSDALSRLDAVDPHPLDDVIPLSFLFHQPIYMFPHLRNRATLKPPDKLDTSPTSQTVAKQTSKSVSNTTSNVNKSRPGRRKTTKNFPPPATDAFIDQQTVVHVNPPDVFPTIQIDRPVEPPSGVQAIQSGINESTRPPDKELLQTPHPLLSPNEQKSIMAKHIPKQKEIDAILKVFRRKVVQTWQVPFHIQDLVQGYLTDPKFRDIYLYITRGHLPGSTNAQKRIQHEILSYVVIDDALFRIVTDEKRRLFDTLLLVIPQKYEMALLNLYHSSLLAGHQRAWKTFLTLRKDFYFHNMLNKIRNFVSACVECQQAQTMFARSVPTVPRVPIIYRAMQQVSVDVKYMPDGYDGYKYLIVVSCELTNFTVAIPARERNAKTIAELLYHRVFSFFGPPTLLIVDEDRALTGTIITILLQMLHISLRIISPYNHGSSKTEERIKQLGIIIKKRLTEKGKDWPVYASSAAYALNTYSSPALNGFSPYELVFHHKPPNLLNFHVTPIKANTPALQEYMQLLRERFEVARATIVDCRSDQTLNRVADANRYSIAHQFQVGDLVALFAPLSSALQSNTTKFRKDFIGPLVINQKFPDDTYLLADLATNKILKSKYPVIRLRPWREHTQSGPVSTAPQLAAAVDSIDTSNPSPQAALPPLD